MSAKSTMSKMDSIETLERVLLDQLTMYEQYAELLKGDAERMARLRIDELEQSNKEKNTILLKLQTMDKARQNLVRQIARTLQMPEESIKITDICTAVGGDTSQRLISIREKLHTIITSLKDIQQHTSLLANTSLAWINGSITALKGLLTPVGTYNYHGKVEDAKLFAGRTVERQV
jgi:hypothetical protein